MEGLKRVSLVDQVYKEIREQIVTLKVPLGMKLNVSKFQETYGVSSTPVREALNRLYNEGLVTLENNVGANVITITPKDVQEIQELNDAYIMAAARYGLEHGQKDHMTVKIKQILSQTCSMPDIKRVVRDMVRVRDVFFEYSQNHRLVEKSTTLNGMNEILNQLLLQTQQKINVSDALIFLQEIEKGVEAGDFNHICNALESYRKWTNTFIIQEISKKSY